MTLISGSHRPHIRHPLTRTYTQYGEIFTLAEEDPDVRAIVLSGIGRAFCAGLDIADSARLFASEDEASRRSLKLYKSIKQFQRCISMPHFITKRTSEGFSKGLAKELSG